MLPCFGYFLGCSLSCWTRAREAMIAESDLVAGFIEFVSAENISVWGIFGKLISTKNAFTGNIWIDVELSDIGPRLSIK